VAWRCRVAVEGEVDRVAGEQRRRVRRNTRVGRCKSPLAQEKISSAGTLGMWSSQAGAAIAPSSCAAAARASSTLPTIRAFGLTGRVSPWITVTHWSRKS